MLIGEAKRTSPPSRSGRPRLGRLGRRLHLSASTPSSDFPPLPSPEGPAGNPCGPQGRRRRGLLLSVAWLRGGGAARHGLAGPCDDGGGLVAPTAGSGFPRVGSTMRGRGSPDGDTNVLVAVPVAGAQVFAFLARTPPTAGSVLRGDGGAGRDDGSFRRRLRAAAKTHGGERQVRWRLGTAPRAPGGGGASW
jgi:hypothetical protein